MSECVMYLIVNKDLRMKAGKVASQVGHVVHLITDEIVRSMYEQQPVPDFLCNVCPVD
jgi:peptidyl-tRNA hydrolase